MRALPCFRDLVLPRSTVRDAMVSIMLAGGPPRHGHHRHSGAPSPFQPLPWHQQEAVGEGHEDARQSDFGEISTNVDEDCWSSNTLAAENKTRALPRDSSTCMLWCAVALGALVRGHPVAQVGLSPPFCVSCTRSLYRVSSREPFRYVHGLTKLQSSVPALPSTGQG